MEIKINDEILTRFLSNDLPVAEQEQVQQWIEEQEAHRQYFLALKKAWQLAGMKNILDHALDEIDVDEKWLAFQRMVNTNSAEPPAEEEDSPPDYIDLESARRSWSWLKSAIAASTVLALGLGWLLLSKRPGPKEEAASAKEEARQLLTKRETNNTGKERTIYLPDSSVVLLADKSEISYQVYAREKQRDSFGVKRDIVLTGKAAFTVAHDSARPFTVFSKDITTTALGTEFTVTAWKESKKISVRLYEGKVVIRPVGQVIAVMKKEVYLVPGQEFTYDGTGRITWFRNNKGVARGGNRNHFVKEEDPLIPDDAGNTWYMFNNQPLHQVLKELSALYHVQIVYNRKDIRNSYFTAKYRSTDTLAIILERIAKLNKLTMTKNDTAYILSK